MPERVEFENVWIVYRAGGRIEASRIQGGAIAETHRGPCDSPEELEAFVRGHGLSGGRCVLILPRASYTSRVLELPSTNPDEIRRMLEHSAPEHVPYPEEDVTVAHREIRRPSNESSEVLAVFVNSRAVAAEIDAFARAGLHVDDVVPSNVALFEGFEETSGADGAVVHVQGRSAELIVGKDGQFIYGRGLELDRPEELADEVRAAVSAFERERDTAFAAETLVDSGDAEACANELSTQLGSRFVPAEDAPLLAAGFVGKRSSVILRQSVFPATERGRRRIEESKRAMIRVGALGLTALVFLIAGFQVRASRNAAYIGELRARVDALTPEAAHAQDRSRHVRALQRQVARGETPLELLATIAEIAPSDALSFTRFAYSAEKGIVLQGHALSSDDFETLLDDLRAVGRTSVPLLANAHEMYRTMGSQYGTEVWAFSIDIPFENGAEGTDFDG